MAMKLNFAAIILALVATVGLAVGQDKKSTLPSEHPPEIVLATAKETDGVLQIRLVKHQRLSFTDTDGKEVRTYGVVVTSAAEVNLEELSLTTKAGKQLTKADVLKRLGKETKAIFFVSEPEPYYLDVFRDDIVVINAKDNEVAWKQVAQMRVAD